MDSRFRGNDVIFKKLIMGSGLPERLETLDVLRKRHATACPYTGRRR